MAEIISIFDLQRQQNSQECKESEEQYIYRICSLKESSGMTWQQVADIIENALSQKPKPKGVDKLETDIKAHHEAEIYLDWLSSDFKKNQEYLEMCEKALRKAPDNRGVKLLRGRFRSWLKEYQNYVQMANTVWTCEQSPYDYYQDLHDKSECIQWTCEKKYLKYDNKNNEFFISQGN